MAELLGPTAATRSQGTGHWTKATPHWTKLTLLCQHITSRTQWPLCAGHGTGCPLSVFPWAWAWPHPWQRVHASTRLPHFILSSRTHLLGVHYVLGCELLPCLTRFITPCSLAHSGLWEELFVGWNERIVKAAGWCTDREISVKIYKCDVTIFETNFSLCHTKVLKL